jgi:hypothetical protein
MNEKSERQSSERREHNGRKKKNLFNLFSLSLSRPSASPTFFLG